MSKRSSRKRQKKDSRGFDFVKFIATAAIRRAIAAGEHMRAWITQDTEDGKIELARSEMALADYAAALAPAITG